jgi:hypothetical protein
MVEPTRGVGVGDGEVADAVGEAFRVRGSFLDDDAGRCQLWHIDRNGLDERIEEVTHTSIQNMDITVLGLSRDHFSTENEQFISVTASALIGNRCDRVRRPLQRLMLSDLVPPSSQRAGTGISLGNHDPIDLPEDQTKKKMGRTWRTEQRRKQKYCSGVGREMS